MFVEAAGNPCLDKKILTQMQENDFGQTSMQKNFWIEHVFRAFLAVLVGRNGVVLRLQRDSQFQKYGAFVQKSGLLFHSAVFEISRRLLTFFLFYRERNIKRQGKTLKNAIQKSARCFQKSKKVHPEVALRFCANFWMEMPLFSNKINKLRPIQQSRSFFVCIPSLEVRNEC